MRWLIDLGNTRLKWAALPEDGRLGEVQALAHAGPAFAPAWRALLDTTAPGQTVWLASVAPAALRERIAQDLQARGLQVRSVQARADCAGLRLGYRDPAEFGVDRFLALLAALGEGPSLVVSIGSAVTLDLLDADGRHHGGLIAPSPAHQQAALMQRFPALQRPAGAVLPFAGSTADALASGSVAATLGLIALTRQRAAERLGQVPRLLLCGGGAADLADALAPPVALRPALVLEGLAAYVRWATAQDGD